MSQPKRVDLGVAATTPKSEYTEANQQQKSTTVSCSLPAMAGVVPFKFQQNDIRVVTGEQGEPWFVGKDVARALGYSKPADAVSYHCEGVQEVRTPSAGGMQRTKIIPEPDVYALIFGSNKAEAKDFKRWVVGEVLPSIRKNGGYGFKTIDFTDPTQVAGLLAQTLEQVQQLTADNATLIPKAEALDRISHSEGDYTGTAAAKALQLKPKMLFKWLEKNKWIYRGGDGTWNAYQSRIDQGHVRHKVQPVNVGQGRERVVQQVRITSAGLALIAKKLDSSTASGEAN